MTTEIPRRPGSNASPAGEPALDQRTVTLGKEEAAPAASLAIPLVIGVTGHRTDSSRCCAGNRTARVREQLLKLRQAYPRTPSVLLSPLAEGANRLVAAVA